MAVAWLLGCGSNEPTSAPSTTATPTGIPSPAATPEPVTSLFLDIEQPETLESVVSEPTITVVGRTRLDAAVSVNNVFADVDADGRFTVPVQLEEGPNIIEVVASVETGEEMVEFITLVYSP